MLGCTHYPLLARTIADVMGPDVVLVSSADETAFEVRVELAGEPAAPSPGATRVQFMTSGDVDDVPAARRAVLGPEVERSGGVVVELTVLGCSGRYGAPAGGACSGYLVRAGDAVIWMDCGNGTFANLQQHIEPGRPHRGRHHARAPRPLRRHLRPARAVQVRPRDATACRCTRPKGVEKRSKGSSASGPTPSTGSWSATATARRSATPTLRFSRTDHPPPTVAVEVAHDGKRLVYTADTGPEWSVEAFGPGADLVLSEATYQHDDIRAPIHLSARQAGEARARGRGAAADAHPLVADARPGSLRRRGLGSVRARGDARGTAPRHRI